MAVSKPGATSLRYYLVKLQVGGRPNFEPSRTSQLWKSNQFIRGHMHEDSQMRRWSRVLSWVLDVLLSKRALDDHPTFTSEAPSFRMVLVLAFAPSSPSLRRSPDTST